MRKYRAWDPVTKEMTYFDLIKASKDQFIASHICLLLADEHPSGGGLMQEFTGLRDKYGVDIYYQDIIKNCENIYRIEWVDAFLQPCLFTEQQWLWFLDGNNHFKYYGQENNTQDYFLFELATYEVEVIGNIYEEMPEPLESKCLK